MAANHKLLKRFGERGRNRTYNLLIKSRSKSGMLLSYFRLHKSTTYPQPSPHGSVLQWY